MIKGETDSSAAVVVDCPTSESVMDGRYKSQQIGHKQHLTLDVTDAQQIVLSSSTHEVFSRVAFTY